MKMSFITLSVSLSLSLSCYSLGNEQPTRNQDKVKKKKNLYLEALIIANCKG
ncbi:hypothetical protein V6Z11_A07G262400 [Gossypium hirsutum]